MKWLIAVLVLVIAQSASAGIYRWTDGSGEVHFSDAPHTGAKTVTLHNQINSYTHVTYGSDQSDSANRSPKAGGGEVIMYGATWCGYCKMARRYFEAHNIPFHEFLIDKDPQAERQYEKLGAHGVPVIFVGNRRMNGFSVAGFRQLYSSR